MRTMPFSKGKGGLLKKIWANKGRPLPPPLPLWICHWANGHGDNFFWRRASLYAAHSWRTGTLPVVLESGNHRSSGWVIFAVSADHVLMTLTRNGRAVPVCTANTSSQHDISVSVKLKQRAVSTQALINRRKWDFSLSSSVAFARRWPIRTSLQYATDFKRNYFILGQCT